jgi:proteasome lid subunit RPN8/RPN11
MAQALKVPRTVRLGPSLAAALLDVRFDHPAHTSANTPPILSATDSKSFQLHQDRLIVADLIIPQQILDDIIAHAKQLAPHECCGLLAGTNGVVSHQYRIKNIVAMEGAQTLSSFDSAKAAHLERLSPTERAEIAFVMDMQDFSAAKKDMRNQGLDLQVVYHSHPHDPARPSITDIKIATDYEEIWPKINLPLPAYLLVSLMNSEPDVKTYWIKSGRVTPTEILIR